MDRVRPPFFVPATGRPGGGLRPLPPCTRMPADVHNRLSTEETAMQQTCLRRCRHLLVLAGMLLLLSAAGCAAWQHEEPKESSGMLQTWQDSPSRMAG